MEKRDGSFALWQKRHDLSLFYIPCSMRVLPLPVNLHNR